MWYIISGILIWLFAGTAGAIMDIKFHITCPSLYFLLGAAGMMLFMILEFLGLK